MRILLSLLLPTLFGSVIYALITRAYDEPLFWLGILFSIPIVFLLMLLPSLLFTLIMEFLGLKLVQESKGQKVKFSKVVIYASSGTLFAVLYSIISEMRVSNWQVFISALTGFAVSIVLLALHIIERQKTHVITDGINDNQIF